ncbi:FkbM family methyltransferase [Aliihoeflea sp. 2WW]|uniref:FkbM family methyltransferase n=1 Tax=Aliihoeflea sp. 2WW TaxID=1381123 RepID=UPI0004636F78|nr:FkbM family methyltransferase [Aliihoeflea sp. 2WW]
MSGLRSAAGLARSLIIYYSRPHRIGRTGRFYRQFAGPGDVTFDIGGHVGNRSRALRRTGAKVITLEPQPLFYRFLKHTLPADITVLPLAVGPHVGRSSMSVSSLHPTVSSLRGDIDRAVKGDPGFDAVIWDETAPIEMITLDALIAEHGEPAFIKIDVEGFEDQVLAGLSRPVPALAFEFLPSMADVAEACIARLESLGTYEFNLMTGEKLRFLSPSWVDAADIRLRVAAAVHEGRSGDVYARRAAG